MAWITFAAVEPLVRADLSADPWIGGLIDNAQGLAEVEIGEQAEPISTGLQAILAQIVARMWQDSMSAEANPAGMAGESIDGYSFQDRTPGTAGLGLTNREKAALKRAAGILPLTVVSTTRGNLETGWVDDDIADNEDLPL